MMIAQSKGKDISNVPASKLEHSGWYATIKYDGNYVQIHKIKGEVKFFTSGGKEFYFPELAKQLIERNKNDFIIEAEYIGSTDGQLGSRVKASTGSFRSQFEKGIETIDTGIFKAFDILYLDRPIIYEVFPTRWHILNALDLSTRIDIAKLISVDKPLSDVQIFASDCIKEGWEGLYLKHRTHIYEPGKRLNTAVKLKYRPTADLVCIGIEYGIGKYEGMIGSLILKDKEGLVVSVGSGLADIERKITDKAFWVGKIIEISYEQKLDTYIQPTYISYRCDKTIKDID